MNLNKEFLSEVISYLISKGVTIHEVMDAYNARFEHEKPEVKTASKGDIDLLLCGRELEKQGFNVEPEPKEKPAPAPLKISLSPNIRDYPTSVTPRGKGVSKARKMLFEVVEGKTVLEHLKANNINYKLFDTRIRKNWTMEKACTTPMTRVIRPYTKSKKSEEHKVVEESSPKTKMMLVNGRMTELEVSDTDFIQSGIEGTKVTTAIIDDVIPSENTAENVTIAPQAETDTDTRVNDTNANSDAIHGDKNDYIEKALKKFITSTTGIELEESKKDKKPKETKSDLTVLEVCQKMNVTTHELREKIENGEFPQPDCDKKWSVKLLKKEGII